MKPLMVTISGVASEAVQATIKSIVEALQNRSVNVTGVSLSKIMFQPSSIMNEDVEFMVNELEYSYTKIPNVVYPTTVLSDNGKDEEFYLNALFEEQKISIIINMSSGVITVYED